MNQQQETKWNTGLEIIPAIDLRGGRCVRLRQGDYAQETVFGDDPVAMAARWVGQNGPRLHLVDLDGARDGIPANADIVRDIVASVDVPCQLGGGVRTDEAVRTLLEDVGLDRVIVGTQALKAPDWFRDIASAFPGQVCLGLDARDSMVATEGWRDVSQTSALELASGYSDLPLAAIIYTNIARDGMLEGIDPGTLRDLEQIAELGPPVIASGGVTTIDDVQQLVELTATRPNLQGAIVGRALYEGTLDLAAAVQLADPGSPG
ncbi:MAG: 1-(5-phosphoribosyl)-5-[(5-phosphoribosylamino)methylideneamino]imidazole-4-carboxamide isomerase [Planctomycetota bacterium]|nr:1-(5-phosphoribosyl)-5-[(5-phosphoribosylamino)methylideneamino]imidazole-4-carboxamide isomerase [Planctomycetota bacterium]